MPFALGIFEESPYEKELISSGVFQGENVLREAWTKKIGEIISQTRLSLPDLDTVKPVFGGRSGKHTEHLQSLLDEMAEVFKIDPTAEW
jgi:ring-1,2-phenylacetyl-CoA epoxidase subunit PaaC